MTECPTCEGIGRCEQGPGDNPRSDDCPTCAGMGLVRDEDAPPMAPGHERVMAAIAAREADNDDRCEHCGESIEFGPQPTTGYTDAADGYCARCVDEFAKVGQ